MLVTAAVFQFAMSSVVRLPQSVNMLPMLVTLPVFQFERSSDSKFEQAVNMPPMLVTLPVFQFERSSDSSAIQPRNILFMLVQSSVLTWLRSMLVQLEKFLNICEQSPVKLTSLVAVTLRTASAGTSAPHLLSLLNSPQISASSPVVLLKM